jgi:hypothetical protein
MHSGERRSEGKKQQKQKKTKVAGGVPFLE